MRLARSVTAFVLTTVVLAPVVAHGQWTWTPQTGRFINLKNLPKETPELQIEFARGLMIDGKYKQALGETGKFNRYYGDTERADENQFLRGEIKMAQGELVEAADEFQVVLSSYPDSQYFDAVIVKQYEIGDSLFEKGRVSLEAKADRRWYKSRWNPFRKRPFKKAIEVYSLVRDNQPFTDEAAQAQYKIGLSHFTREQYMEAGLEYRQLLDVYPNSEYVREASFGLVQTYHELSLSPDYDQDPSQLTIDRIDDFTAQFSRDERLEELAQIRAEMTENIAQQRLQTAKFYERRRLFLSAHISYQALMDQYPDTEAGRTAQEWLSQHAGPQSTQARFVGLAD